VARPWPGFTKIQRYGAMFQRVSTCFNVFQRVSTCFNVFVISCHMSDICLVLTCTRHFNFHPVPFIWRHVNVWQLFSWLDVLLLCPS